MKTSRILLIFLLLQVVSCTPSDEEYGPAYVMVTNNSERNIARVRIADVKSNLVLIDERDDELIANSGNSKTFKINGNEIPGNFIVCVEAQDSSELMCSVKFYLNEFDKIFFAWGGDKSSVWQPLQLGEP